MECKGLIYKAKENQFKNSKGHFVLKCEMVPMKRLSCSGCESCGGIYDCIEELDPIFPDVIEHNQLYELVIGNVSTDWESGIVDDFDLMFVKIEGGT